MPAQLTHMRYASKQGGESRASMGHGTLCRHKEIVCPAGQPATHMPWKTRTRQPAQLLSQGRDDDNKEHGCEAELPSRPTSYRQAMQHMHQAACVPLLSARLAMMTRSMGVRRRLR